MVVQIFLKQTS